MIVKPCNRNDFLKKTLQCHAFWVAAAILSTIDMFSYSQTLNQVIQVNITSRKSIEIVTNETMTDGQRQELLNQISVYDNENKPIDIGNSSVGLNRLNVFTIHELDFRKNYKIRCGKNDYKWARLSQKFINLEFSPISTKLGTTIHRNRDVDFVLWSPPAINVEVFIFSAEDQDKLVGRKLLDKNSQGIWRANISPNEFGLDSLDGFFYQYEIDAYGKKEKALDPYALSMAAFSPEGADKIGKAAIVDLDNPRAMPLGENFSYSNKNNMASQSDFVGYEMHVRDFTISPNLNIRNDLKGTYVGFNKKIDHLKELGVSHVQLMPIHNFYTVDETNRAYSDDKTPEINYNWGYDPHNYFTPEGWFSTDAKDPYARIRELRNLINTLHKYQIGVVIDAVYNHTINESVFENVCPGCYYRLDEFGNISHSTGAGPTVESRNPMVRKLIIDSAKLYVEKYGINGFRFDLMGFIDNTTMEELRNAVGKDIIMYGEGWLLSDIPADEGTTKINLPHHIDVGAFSDGVRNSIGGGIEEGGFVTGSLSSMLALGTNVIGGLKQDLYSQQGFQLSQSEYHRFTETSSESINFISIHDGPTQWDKINSVSAIRGMNTSFKERVRRSKLSAALLFTTQGKIVLHGGIEIARTKPLTPNDPSPARSIPSQEANLSLAVGKDPDLPLFRAYHENSYSSPDYTNMIRWSRKYLPEYTELFNYYKDLIRLKRKSPLFQINLASDIQDSVKFLPTVSNQVLAYSIQMPFDNYSSFLIIHNGSEGLKNIDFSHLSEKCWKVVLDENKLDFRGIEDSEVEIKSEKVVVPRVSSTILGNICGS